MKLQDRIALVTGGATGIGRATAELFAAEGAHVVILDYNESEGRAAVDQIGERGGHAQFLPVDVRSAASMAAAFEQVAEVAPKLDILVNSAGVLKGAFTVIDALSEEDWDMTLDTNLKGTFLTIKHSAPLLEKAGESVMMLLASGAGVKGPSSSYAYAASKAAIYGLRFKLEKELGPRGVRVHIICPGNIDTPLKLENVAQGAEARGEDSAAVVEKARDEKLGDPAGVARVLTFLASDDGSYVRGTIFTR